MSKTREHDVYAQYYLLQANNGVSALYSVPLHQKGYGIGSFFGGLFRCAFPILKKSTAAVGNEILKSGVNVISDIGNNHDIESSIKKRGKEAVNNLGKVLSEKMFGAGYTSHNAMKRVHSGTNHRGEKKRKVVSKTKNTKQKKKTNKTKKPNKSVKTKKEILDIFS